jgi:uncharacterized membrane protein YeaQ/YmgE (transglycosylase-associated protein family)
MITSIISWIVFGLIVGAIARFLVPGEQSMGWIATILVGVAGSFVGGGLSWLFFGTPDNAIHPASWIMSILGGILVVLAYIRLSSKPGPQLK